MAMDKRQAQIRERAGLEESRLNQDFIDFMRKWSTPILLVIAVAALSTVGYTRFHKAQLAKVDKAFEELDLAGGTSSPNPEALKDIAQQYAGQRAVPVLARLEAGDAYLRAVRSGLAPGAQLNAQTGEPEHPEDVLNDEQKKDYLSRAEALYREVAQETAQNSAQTPLRLGALFGLASVAESRQDFEGARKHYEEAAAAAGEQFAVQATIARNRIGKLDELKTLPTLYSKKDLPPEPKDETAAPEITAMPRPAGLPMPPPGGGQPGVNPAPGAPAGENPAGPTAPTNPAPPPAPGTTPPSNTPTPTPTTPQPAPAPAPK